MKRHEEEEKEPNTERWALTYSDMITLLLVLFIMMYTMSTVDAEKFKSLASQLSQAFNATETTTTIGGEGDGLPWDGKGLNISSNSESNNSSKGTSSLSGEAKVDKDFKDLYLALKKSIKDQGLEKSIDIEKGDTYIGFKFKDGILFKPDTPDLRTEGVKVLKNLTGALTKANSLIGSIKISGHTADFKEEQHEEFFEWRLSTNRALSVLEFMVKQS
ncbi:MAG: chemotaxis protein MotB, partial [Oscillospiraceae bacterium]|nr:chemotaxis protein MotB [Oscillospiraceae bacterium]